MNRSSLLLLASCGLLLAGSGCASPETNQSDQSAAAAAAAAAASNTSGLSRNPQTQIVIDRNTNLQWEDDGTNMIERTWEDANQHCTDLDFSGHTDWRLATTEELVALAKATKVKFPKKPILRSIPSFGGNFWSSDLIYKNAAYAVKFDTFDWGEVGEATFNLEYSVRCVRNIE